MRKSKRSVRAYSHKVLQHFVKKGGCTCWTMTHGNESLGMKTPLAYRCTRRLCVGELIYSRWGRAFQSCTFQYTFHLIKMHQRGFYSLFLGGYSFGFLPGALGPFLFGYSDGFQSFLLQNLGQATLRLGWNEFWLCKCRERFFRTFLRRLRDVSRTS